MAMVLPKALKWGPGQVKPEKAVKILFSTYFLLKEEKVTIRSRRGTQMERCHRTDLSSPRSKQELSLQDLIMINDNDNGGNLCPAALALPLPELKVTWKWA